MACAPVARSLTIALSSGLRLSALAYGDLSAERRIIGLHGWLDNAATFARLVPLLGLTENECLVSVDFPGHGRADHASHASAYGGAELAIVVHQALEALAWKDASIVSHSMGAVVGQLVAGAFPDRINCLVCVDALGAQSLSPAHMVSDIARRAEGLTKLMGKTPRTYATWREASEAMANARGCSRIAADTLLARGAEMSADGRVRPSHDLFQKVPGIRMSEEQVTSMLRAIRAPVLFCHPKSGLPLFVNDEMRDARFEAVEKLSILNTDGGHHVHLDHPEWLASHVIHFLRHGQLEGGKRIVTVADEAGLRSAL